MNINDKLIIKGFGILYAISSSWSIRKEVTRAGIIKCIV
ncbi:hypothetical protein DCCM_3506 [Desulfocucumis palustris]|uniref:Uncharacterized protein n=1 Tax=Desulfocucumis palustris TaxID=1898651 RepID=A0A2L2XFC4_9FIRM|nr:hypothetical protein DCCM_3506 [Desulfocucumis palustris]